MLRPCISYREWMLTTTWNLWAGPKFSSFEILGLTWLPCILFSSSFLTVCVWVLSQVVQSLALLQAWNLINPWPRSSSESDKSSEKKLPKDGTTCTSPLKVIPGKALTAFSSKVQQCPWEVTKVLAISRTNATMFCQLFLLISCGQSKIGCCSYLSLSINWLTWPQKGSWRYPILSESDCVS